MQRAVEILERQAREKRRKMNRSASGGDREVGGRRKAEEKEKEKEKEKGEESIVTRLGGDTREGKETVVVEMGKGKGRKVDEGNKSWYKFW